MKRNFEIIARAVILKNNKILVCKNIKQNDKYYYLPGGHIEFGEPAEIALARELKEELDLSVKSMRFIGALENVFKQNKKNHHEVNLVFNVVVNEIKDKSCEDHLGFLFLHINEFKQKDFLGKF
jgi:8-oxo-dGTP diphosphatase